MQIMPLLHGLSTLKVHEAGVEKEDGDFLCHVGTSLYIRIFNY